MNPAMLFLFMVLFALLKPLTADEEEATPDTLTLMPAVSSKNAVFPIVFYSDETSLAAGVMDQYLRQPAYSNKASSFLIFGFYTLNKQYLFEMKPELYLDRDRWKIVGEVEYTFWPTTHCGIGNAIPRRLSEEYTQKELNIDLAFERLLTEEIYLGAHYVFNRQSFSDLVPGGLLDTERPLGLEEGIISGLGLSFSWDSRDSNIYPKRGAYHQFSFNLHDPVLGSEYSYQSFKSDMRYYLTLGQRHVLAFQNIFLNYRRDVPFQMMESVGNFLRGYEENRIMDASLHAFQLEYRLPLFWRVGVVGFAGAGQVSPDLRTLGMNRYHLTSGFGLRFGLIPEEMLNLRFDIGFGEDDLTIDMNMLEAF